MLKLGHRAERQLRETGLWYDNETGYSNKVLD